MQRSVEEITGATLEAGLPTCGGDRSCRLGQESPPIRQVEIGEELVDPAICCKEALVGSLSPKGNGIRYVLEPCQIWGICSIWLRRG